MTRTSRTGSPPILASFAVLFGSALAAAWLLYGLLESTGIVKSRGAEIGGAAAGFLVVFWAAHRVYAALCKAWESRKARAGTEQELRRRIEVLEQGDVPAIECPDGFVRHVSRDHGIGFSRPRSWARHQEVFLGLFMRPVDEADEHPEFQANMAVTVFPYSMATEVHDPTLDEEPEESLLRAPILRAALFYGTPPDTVEWDETYIQDRKAFRGVFTYVHPEAGIPIYMEGVTVLDPPREQVFIFALHAARADVEVARDVFRRVVSTARLWEPQGDALG